MFILFLLQLIPLLGLPQAYVKPLDFFARVRCGVHCRGFAECPLPWQGHGGAAAAPGGFFQGSYEPLRAWVGILGVFIKRFRHHQYWPWPFLCWAMEKRVERQRIPAPSKGGGGSSRLSFSSAQTRTKVRPCNYPERRLVSGINPWGGGEESCEALSCLEQASCEPLAFRVVPVIVANIQEAAFGSC